MGLLRRYRWFVAAAGITLAFATVSLLSHQSLALTSFGDLAVLTVMVLAAAAAFSNVSRSPVQERSFWTLMSLGLLLWACNQGAWSYYEILLRRFIPDPFSFDIVLFFHLVPMIAAVAWRPDLLKTEGRLRFSTLNFLLLLGWWIFLYAFIVFPRQYIVHDVRLSDYYYDLLYELENGFLLIALGLAAFTSSGGWRKVYLNFLTVAVIYGVCSELLDSAVSNNTYYSGSLYDVPLIGAVAWVAATALSAREWDLKTDEFMLHPRWRKLIPRMAMLAILSLPALGLWTVLLDQSPMPARIFRICAVLTAMVVLGAFVFLRQYVQDQALVDVLNDSRRAYDTQKRLQTQLVQKEKLASLGNLVAGAAREIDHPLSALLTCSEQLWAHERLTDQQNTLLRKIVTHAQRTRDLVANLLSFAQQSPGEKILVDMTVLLSRAVPLLESRHPGGKIRISLSISSDFPRVQGNANRLFQVFVEIIENALDALHEAGGGSLEITARRQGNEAVLQFSDTGPGVREPERVFDPFYTTKPVGKGAGLGLSVVYGVIQDHGGQITCHNKPEGGALFVVRLPAAASPALHVAGAADAAGA
jgi:signal transduction histidine kinase